MNFQYRQRKQRVAVKNALLGFAALCWAAASPALTWNIVYDDVVQSTGLGFDDPANGATRRATLDAVTGYLSSVLTSSQGNIDLLINQSQDDGAGPLGTGGTYFTTSPNGFSNGFAFDRAMGGADRTSAVLDAFVTFDFGYNYNNGLDAPAPNQFDLYSVALHEIMHGLGFLTLLNPDGTSVITGSDPGVYSVFNSRLVRGDGRALFAPNGDFIGNPSDLTSDDLFFDGAAVRQENNGDPAKLHAPGTYQPGSSVAHLDPNVFPNAVLNPTLTAGQQRRQLTPIEHAILLDLGYNVVAVSSNPGNGSGTVSAAAVSLPSSLLLHLLLLPLAVRQRRPRLIT